MTEVRLDKWLWAARLFKTRALAKAAIEGGKVKLNGERTKPSKIVAIEQTLTLKHGWDDKTLIITALSDQRRNATEAAKLYFETEQSIQLRQQRAEERKAAKTHLQRPAERPTKKQRRQIHRFKEQQ